MPCYFPWMDGDNSRPCRKCPYCLMRRANNWIFRCMQETKVADSFHWVTLTYDQPPFDDNGLMSLDKTDVQKFFKRLRKRKREHSTQKIKYFAVGEYGSRTKRPHYHAVIFNSTQSDIQSSWDGFYSLDQELPHVLGSSFFDQVNERTIAYTAKYMFKGKTIPAFKGDLRKPEFQLFSKDLGINFITDATRTFYSEDPRRSSVTVNGFRKALPDYFVRKFKVCPVYDLAKAEYAKAQALAVYATNMAGYLSSENSKLPLGEKETYWKFLNKQRNHAMQQFRDRQKQRNKI